MEGQDLVYESGDWGVDLSRRELLAKGTAVPIGARAFEIIEVLVRSANELVTKNDLMDLVWPGAVVEEHTLHVHISAIRKALGQDRAMLKTAPGRGYRLLGPWILRRQAPVIRPTESPSIREPNAPVANHFPLIAGHLVGRAAAALHVRDLVSAHRVVTLTGPGGIGKTSLAIEAIRDIVSSFDNGAWFVDLGAMSNPDLLPSIVASTLGLRLSGEISAESIARAVVEKQLLLVLDNCEHVIEAVAPLVERIVRLAPQTTLLATSREVLRIDGEAVYRVPPLDVPPLDVSGHGQEAREYILGHSAVELFIAKLHAMGVTYSPSDDDLSLVASICRRLDGIPLAIEFAASSAALLGIKQVTEGLRDRFPQFTSGRRTALSRQRTLRATLDWSYDLLPEAERSMLRHLAAFQGGFTLAAIVAVVADTGTGAETATENVANLVAKSLLALDTTRPATRWRLLETVRIYALEKLVEASEIDAARKRHALHFRDLFAPLRAADKSSLSHEEFSRCEEEVDNVRAALEWSFSPDGDPAVGVDLTVVFAPVWQHLALMKECREFCERALTVLDPYAVANIRPRMRLQIAVAGIMFLGMEAVEQAKTILTEVLETADTLNDADTQAWALASLRTLCIDREDYVPARIFARRIDDLAAHSRDPSILRVAWRSIGSALLASGRLRDAQTYYERVLRSPTISGDRRGMIFYSSNDQASVRAMLAQSLWLQGSTTMALDEAHASLEGLHGADQQLLLCRVLYYGLCRIAPMIGDYATAEREIARLIELATRSNAQFWEIAGRFMQGKLLVLRGQYEQGLSVLRNAFEASGRTGWRLSYPEFKGALAMALAGLGQPDEALGVLEDAISIATAGDGANSQAWYAPELLRIKGEVLLQRAANGDAQAAETCFTEAGAMAREQGAMFWALRIALSLAGLCMTQGRSGQAQGILESISEGYADAYETPDLRAMRTMLDGLRT